VWKTSRGADQNVKRESKIAAQPGALIHQLITRRHNLAGEKIKSGRAGLSTKLEMALTHYSRGLLRALGLQVRRTSGNPGCDDKRAGNQTAGAAPDRRRSPRPEAQLRSKSDSL
jgi:hypothetical protein